MAVMPNLSNYTGYGNSVLTPQAANQSNPNNGSAPPTIPGAQPIGQYTNQATQLNPNYGPNVHGGAMSFINNFNASHPLMNLSVDAFNKANGPNTPAAYQMLQQGGQQFRNAVMAANGWSQDQMNQWLNQVAYEGQNVFSPQASNPATWVQYGATYAQPTQYGPQGYAQGFTGPQTNMGQLGLTDYTKSPTYGNNPANQATAPTSPAPASPAAPVPTVNGGTNVYGGNGLSGLPNNNGGGSLSGSQQPPPAPPILSAYGGSAAPVAKPKILLGGSR